MACRVSPDDTGGEAVPDCIGWRARSGFFDRTLQPHIYATDEDSNPFRSLHACARATSCSNFLSFMQDDLPNDNFTGKMTSPVFGELLVNTSEFRRENFRHLADANGGPTAVAKLLGYTNASYVVQMIGPNPTRPVTERTARKVESVFGLPVLSLDKPVEVEPTPNAAPALPRGKPTSGMSASEFVEVINVVVRICEEERASFSNRKFADIVSLVVMDADRRGGGADETMVRTLVHLAQ